MKKLLIFLSVFLAMAGSVQAEYKIDGGGRLTYLDEGEVLASQSGQEFDEAEFDRVMDEMEKELDAAEIELAANDGFLDMTAIGSGGNELEIGAQQELTIDKSWESLGIKVAAEGTDGFRIDSGGQSAVTTLTVLIKTEDNTVWVDGYQLKVLPGEVVKRLLAENVIDEVTGGQGMTIERDSKSGTVAYHILGESKQKFLWFGPVSISREVWVSVDTGETLRVVQQLKDRIVDWLAF